MNEKDANQDPSHRDESRVPRNRARDGGGDQLHEKNVAAANRIGTFMVQTKARTRIVRLGVSISSIPMTAEMEPAAPMMGKMDVGSASACASVAATPPVR